MEHVLVGVCPPEGVMIPPEILDRVRWASTEDQLEFFLIEIPQEIYIRDDVETLSNENSLNNLGLQFLNKSQVFNLLSL